MGKNGSQEIKFPDMAANEMTVVLREPWSTSVLDRKGSSNWKQHLSGKKELPEELNL